MRMVDLTTPLKFVTRDLTVDENPSRVERAAWKPALLDDLEVNGDRVTIRRRDNAVDELKKRGVSMHHVQHHFGRASLQDLSR